MVVLNFEAFYLTMKYFGISNLEIRNQTLMIFCFKSLILCVRHQLDYTVFTLVTNACHDKFQYTKYNNCMNTTRCEILAC